MDKNTILKTNISSGMIWKIFSLIFVYLTVPFLLQYLGKEYYGVWVTIFTLLNTAYFMDIGIALGLKNKLTEALAKKDRALAKTYISTAYFSILIIVFLFFILSLVMIYIFDMHRVFNTHLDEKNMKTLLIYSVVLVFISVVLNIYKSIYGSFQQSAKVELAMALYQALVFLQILFLPKILDKSILLVSIVYGSSNIIIAIVFSILFFTKNRDLFPSIIFFKTKRVKEILGLGFHFFIIQLALIVILSTDNLIITNIIGPESTASYSIILKLYQPFLILSVLIFTPLWTLYTDAFHHKDYQWIKNTLRRMNYLFLSLVFALILLYFNFHWIIALWIPEGLDYTRSLLLLMSLFVLIRIYGDIYMTFLNGIGKIKLQMWLYIFGAIINIPLSILFVKYFNLGSSGVILATCVSLISLAILMPIQAKRVLAYSEK